jgi:hypothetical protein
MKGLFSKAFLVKQNRHPRYGGAEKIIRVI